MTKEAQGMVTVDEASTLNRYLTEKAYNQGFADGTATLTAENARLREALEEMAYHAQTNGEVARFPDESATWFAFERKCRAALSPKQEDKS